MIKLVLKIKNTVICGIFIDEDLIETFELGELTNDELINYYNRIQKFKLRQLYLI